MPGSLTYRTPQPLLTTCSVAHANCFKPGHQTPEQEGTGSERCHNLNDTFKNLLMGYLLMPDEEDAARVLSRVGKTPVDVLHQDVHLV